ncbi:hypothetical protein [Streptomyces rubellomurinus]|uniref:Uncharacterized protein n=1 Tax=Streptomyces rubellomurinus (strain ATCC 31215) TaxID=359131 RepID=A0A0F2T8Y1_STRR3|nr:hypothetical protein [Streptomyces rubellomurinus]KJS59658.1 hypothetical protein VM95_25865 [Streptomyces rubellomurinus]
MTATTRLTALAVLAAAALSLGAAAASASAHTRHLEPPITVQQCKDDDGWVATDIVEQREICASEGELDDHYIVR